jgi:hypothetical protein
MKILIYTTHRTGSTALAQLFMSHYKCDYHRGSLIYPIPNDIIIKITPSESKYNIIESYFDKKIVLTRNNITDQAESRVYADLVEKKFEPYTIDKSFLVKNESKIKEMEQIIVEENRYLLSSYDCLFLTYDELYYSPDGLNKLEGYLDTKFAFRINSNKKYRNGTKSLL